VHFNGEISDYEKNSFRREEVEWDAELSPASNTADYDSECEGGDISPLFRGFTIGRF